MNRRSYYFFNILWDIFKYHYVLEKANKKTRERNVGDNLKVQKTKRAEKLKTLYRGFENVSGKP